MGEVRCLEVQKMRDVVPSAFGTLAIYIYWLQHVSRAAGNDILLHMNF